MKNLYAKLPDTPGVYIMRDGAGEVIYIGKAVNLKRRVSSYFLRPHDSRIEGLVRRIAKIDHKNTDTAIEALVLEAELTKKYQPFFNIREKDDKSFLYIEIEKEMFPRVLLVRGKDRPKGKRYGPFTSAAQAREALKILRRIFPFSTHETNKLMKRPCFDYQIGLCPGTCIGKFSRVEYLENVRNLKLFLEGKKKKIIAKLKKEMTAASRSLEYEKAGELKRKLFALQHIQDVALIGEDRIGNREYRTTKRIEGYDISNISGTNAVGSMVVFVNNEPAKSEYRKFRIKTVTGQDDFAMLQEVIERRLKHPGWPLPDLMLIDGGRGQVSAVKAIVTESGRAVPVIGIAKGPKRKRNDLIGKLPDFTDKKTLIRVRDEAHRFAISYHRALRRGRFLARQADYL